MFKNPDKNCPFCPRLAAFRTENRMKFPDRFNAPVPSFGADDPTLLIVGLAPGLKGANFSGRPFTGDYAGDTLYAALIKHGFATGTYGRSIDDGIELPKTRITNAVRCVPPENKPVGAEISKCRTFLERELQGFKNLKAVIVLGTVAHNSFLRAAGVRPDYYKFGHGNVFELKDAKHLNTSVHLISSYHCSRYNISTKRLNDEMFDKIFVTAREILGSRPVARRA